MSTSLVLVKLPPDQSLFALTDAQNILRRMVLDSVQSIHSRRNYAKALYDLFVFCASRPLSRALLLANHDRSSLSVNYERPVICNTKARRRSAAQWNDWT
jgi:hypothetical protein